jgi:hypothetical protein
MLQLKINIILMKKTLLIFAMYSVLLSTSAQNHSWLVNAKEKLTTPSVLSGNAFLGQINGSMRMILCKYEGSLLVQKNTFTDSILKMPASQWLSSISLVNDPKEKDVIEISIRFKITKGSEKSTGVAVAFDFSDWSLQNYVFAPAVLYGGNRFKIEPVGYPPYIYNPSDRGLDMPVTTTDILHLNKDGSPSKVEMLTGNCASPMLAFYNPDNQRAFILITEQATRFGNSGMFVEENMTGKQATFVISAPGVREQRYAMCGRENSGDTAADWTAGDEVSMNFRVYNVSVKDIPDFFEKIFEVRKSLSGKNEYRNVTPYSAVANMILNLHDGGKWYEDDKYGYTCEDPKAEVCFNHLQLGWGGSPFFTLPMVIMPTPERVRKAAKTFDQIVSLQAPTGLFYGIFMKGRIFGDNFKQNADRPFIAMTRRTADILYIGIQQIEILQKLGYGTVIKSPWDSSLLKAADALVNVWNRYGQFGQTINVETGEMEVNGSTAGVASVGALALASQYFKDPRYLDVAKKACRYYYERDFKKGYAGGGAAEILQSPDSETPWDMAESAMGLFEMTGEKEWLEIAKNAVYMLSTWTVSYDYRFPQDCDMGRSNCHATGSIFASSQNNHSAPGLYILSGDFLLKLYRATGDQRFAELYKDLAHNTIQYVNTTYNPTIRKGSEGATSERVNLSDWEGRGEIGNTWPGSSVRSWETLELLTSLQNPGIYIRNDTGEILVLDHVEASVIKRDRNGVTIRVTNPTTYDAMVSVLSENSAQVTNPLGRYAYLNWKKIEIKAGQTADYLIKN